MVSFEVVEVPLPEMVVTDMSPKESSEAEDGLPLLGVVRDDHHLGSLLEVVGYRNLNWNVLSVQVQCWV